MENCKEIIRTFLVRHLLGLLLLVLPGGIQSAAAYGFRASGAAASGDSLSCGTTACSTEANDTVSEHILDLTPIGPTAPVRPIDSIKTDPAGPLVPQPFKPGAACSVGTPEGVLSVSSSGAAVYSLAFDVPNGGALTPQVGLSYNSQSGGYGLAGYGFGITGLSAITRGGHDLFHDGRLAGVTYTASDNLFIDGKRLMLQSGDPGQDGAVYTVEGDPFTKVTVHGSYGDSAVATWFEVTTGSGMTYQYGNSPDSKIAYKNGSGHSHVASWYVNRATDRHSNYITYEYAVSSLCIRPTSIVYGTNSARSRGIVCTVSFAYQSLGDNARPFAIEDRQGTAPSPRKSMSTRPGATSRKLERLSASATVWATAAAYSTQPQQVPRYTERASEAHTP